MKMLSKILYTSTLFAFLACSSWVQGQGYQYGRFVEDVHDLGTVDASKTEFGQFTYRLRNLSAFPIKILSAESESQYIATSPEKSMVQPDKSGYVLVTLDVRSLSGAFEETVNVQIAKIELKTGETNTREVQNLQVKLKGNVIARKKGPADWYPYKQGNLWFSKQMIEFGRANDRNRFSDTSMVYNGGSKSIEIKSLDIPKGFELTGLKAAQTIAPGDSVKLVTTLVGTEVKEYDWLHQRIVVQTNDDTLSAKEIRIHAVILPDFANLSKSDSAKAPEITVEKLSHDFGDITDSKSVSYDFQFKNSGKSELKILKVQASCGCTAGKPDQTELKSDEKSKIRVTFDPTGRAGIQVKQIRIVTNDPKNPLVQLTIQANVKSTTSTPAIEHK